MKDRPLIQRGLYRRALRRHKGSVSIQQKEMIQAVLSDKSLFEMVYEQAMQKVEVYAKNSGEFSVAEADDGSPVVDNLLKLLTWFLDNGPELVRMIELIIGLFGGMNAVAFTDDEHEGESL